MRSFLIILLFPFALIFWVITTIRNFLYDSNILRSVRFDLPVICVGNLSVGGTGKSPVTEAIIRILLAQKFKVATLSRGYGRQTSGFLTADKTMTSEDIGDEPLQFSEKFPEVMVCVCENRVEGVKRLLIKETKPEVIVLDDAFQHRKIHAGLNILLTQYSKLYINDYILPSGSLRECRTGASRAQIIIVTKCPENLSEDERNFIRTKIKPKKNQEVIFSFIRYKNPVSFFTRSEILTADLAGKKLVVFSGIAGAQPMLQYLAEFDPDLINMSFPDHHSYSGKDFEKILNKFINIADGNKLIITTEKDYIRLKHKTFIKDHKEIPLYYLPIEMEFFEIDKPIFEQNIIKYAGKN